MPAPRYVRITVGSVAKVVEKETAMKTIWQGIGLFVLVVVFLLVSGGLIPWLFDLVK
jgi:hypothetical protein